MKREATVQKKKRKSKYDEIIKVEGSFEDIVKLAVKGDWKKARKGKK